MTDILICNLVAQKNQLLKLDINIITLFIIGILRFFEQHQD